MTVANWPRGRDAKEEHPIETNSVTAKWDPQMIVGAFEPSPFEGYNSLLGTYSAWLLDQAKIDGRTVLDLPNLGEVQATHRQPDQVS